MRLHIHKQISIYSIYRIVYVPDIIEYIDSILQNSVMAYKTGLVLGFLYAQRVNYVEESYVDSHIKMEWIKKIL